MSQIASSPDSQESKPGTFRLWWILRLLPIVVMLLVLGILIFLFLMGGLMKITAWYIFQFIPPFLGAVSLIALIIYMIVKRKFSRLCTATLIISIVSLYDNQVGYWEPIKWINRIRDYKTDSNQQFVLIWEEGHGGATSPNWANRIYATEYAYICDLFGIKE